jgi:hypothetical protein
MTTAILVCCLLSACTREQPVGTIEFIDMWSGSVSNSAVSYWYEGENRGRHVIVEKWPGKSITYHVEKSRVRIVGIYGVFSGSDETSLNLKQENIEIIEDSA